MPSPYEKYRSNVLATATKVQKLVIVFNGIIKILNKAIKSIENQDLVKKSTYLHAAAEAFDNLRAGIDTEKGGEFAVHLDEFCLRICNKIFMLNMSATDPNELNDVISAITQVRDVFKEEKVS